MELRVRLETISTGNVSERITLLLLVGERLTEDGMNGECDCQVFYDLMREIKQRKGGTLGGEASFFQFFHPGFPTIKRPVERPRNSYWSEDY